MKYALFALLATASSLAQAESNADGKVSLKGQSFDVVDGLSHITGTPREAL